MRKFVVPVLLTMALFLAACGGGTATNTGTPAGTMSATGEATMATTPLATSAATMSATGEATMATTPSATTSATTAATSQATMATTPAATTGTPEATQSGSTGSTTASSQFISLKALLSGQVSASDNTQVGQVAGILVQHPVVSAAGQATATPAPTTSGAAAQSPFTVRYVLVNAASSSTGSSATGDVVVLPWQALAAPASGSASAGSYTLTVSSSVFTGSPRAAMSDIQSGSGAWASSADAYWASQGLTIPATGSASGNPSDSLFLMTNSSDALKLVDQANTTLGTTTDALIDPATGQIVYFQVNGGANLGNKTYVIPASLFQWTPGSGSAAVNNPGQFSFNFPSSVLSNFPNIDLSNGLDQNTLNQLNQFWQGIQNSGSSQ